MDFLSAIPIINEDRNYWLVRTNSGRYFNDFYFDGFIGINWNKISDIAKISERQNEDSLIADLIKEYPNEARPKHVVHQIQKFVNEIKKGDIVMIPSENSEWIAFGEVKDEKVYLEESLTCVDENADENSDSIERENSDPVCPFVKRRKVEWVDHKKRSELDPNLFGLLYSHQTISSANAYADYIDRELHPLYLKNDAVHLMLDVNKKGKISGYELGDFISKIINVVDEFNDISGLDYDKREVETKINVQSPGYMELIGEIAILAVIAFTAITIMGGEVSFLGLKYKTDGLSKTILEWLKTINENKQLSELKEAADKLEISVPCSEDVKKRLEEEAKKEETDEKKEA